MVGNARGLQRLEGEKSSLILQELILRNDLPSRYSLTLILKCKSWNTSGQSYRMRLETALIVTFSTCLFISRDTLESQSNPREFTEWTCAMLTVLKCQEFPLCSGDKDP